jgi:tol-pal system protein YbgF
MLRSYFLRGCCAIALLTSACAVGRPPPEASRAHLESQLTAAERRLAELSRQVAGLQAALDDHRKSLQEIDAASPAEPALSQPPAATDHPLPGFGSAETMAEIAPDPAPGVPPPAALPGKPAEGTPATPEALYRQALEAYQAGSLKTASTLFEDFYKQHPQHTLADNALYWTGECQYARKRYLKAIDTFKSVLQHHPNGGKVPDALLKTGYSYLALGDKTNGRHYLQQVVRQYPFSPAGARAEERLSVTR